ncbi:uncharacterized protein G2W53_021570 [Senna tora]|uniref:Uncharacterized protein n=1 Tax=Senna tora TaxID=362788 RepID=A0A834TM12_9FABA|nr:uncharacterized protein G2W53_021570 [Senna tora]
MRVRHACGYWTTGLSLSLSHDHADLEPHTNHDRTTRRLRALHGPPLHLRTT